MHADAVHAWGGGAEAAAAHPEWVKATRHGGEEVLETGAGAGSDGGGGRRRRRGAGAGGCRHRGAGG